MAQRFCPQCGTPFEMGAKFCPSCGAHLDASDNNANSNEQMEMNSNTTVYFNHSTETEKPDLAETSMNQSPNTPLQTKKVIYADFGERFVAFLIDSIILSVIGSIFFWGDFRKMWGFETMLAIAYFWISEMASNGSGKTIGKAIVKIRTVDSNTYGNITPGQAFLHVIGKAAFLPIDVILGLILKDSDPEREQKEMIRITQSLSKTVVIKEDVM